MLIKNRDDIEKIRFIVQAINKDDGRIFCRSVCSYDDHVFCTDGHRLAYFKSISIPEGCYSIVKNRKTLVQIEPNNGQLPNKNILDGILEPDSKSVELPVRGFLADENDRMGKVQFYLYEAILGIGKEMGENYGVNPAYLLDAIFRGIDKMLLEDNGGRVRVINPIGCTTVVMSMRLTE